jgi:radical SAM superfamily enzyme YgiQ (UPF0313 family)
MYLGAIIKEWKKDDRILIDAIAEELNIKTVIKRLNIYQPELLVFMAGIESFTEDMQTITAIKANLPSVKIACMGYLPTIFPEETFKCNPAIDYIVMNEPELSFSEMYDAFKERKDYQNIQGLAYRKNGDIAINQPRERIRDLDKIPFPAWELVNINLYNEFFLKKPFATILTSRGCPFGCAFCIPTYGKEMTFRSVENVVTEIEELVLKYKVQTIRFLDDTFTLNRNRTMELCSLILKRNLKFQWVAMTRVGTLDKEMARLMKKTGAKRIYLGIETSSQRVLDCYQKGYNADLIKEQVRLIKENNIEVTGFFIVGGIQTEDEFKKDVVLAKQLDLEYVNATDITPYPGTRLFGELKDKVTFSLFPYLCTFRDRQLQEKGLKLSKLFFYNFYLRPRYFMKMLKFLFLTPQDLIRGLKRVLQFIFCYQNNNKQKSQPRFI